MYLCVLDVEGGITMASTVEYNTSPATSVGSKVILLEAAGHQTAQTASDVEIMIIPVKSVAHYWKELSVGVAGNLDIYLGNVNLGISCIVHILGKF